MHDGVPWEELPSLALVNIFCRTSIKDRSRILPFVCRSWAHASRHPLCWASMVAKDSHPFADSAADLAFVMDSHRFVDPFDGTRSPLPHAGVARLQSLIGRAAGGASVVSVYFFPFLTSAGGPPNDDDILRLIANHCPNLKHISFHGSHSASQEAMFKVIHTCKKLELVDFSDTPYFNPLILGELSRCCPNIKGIRRSGHLEPSFSSALSTGFPSLKLLSLSGSDLIDKDLLTIATGSKELCYLDIRDCPSLIYYMHIVKRVCTRIGKILYD